MSINTGGSAFPNWPESAFPSTFKSFDPETGQIHRWGMTLRDYFAAKALPMFNGSGDFNWSAEQAYKMADAMLKAREQP